MYKHIFIPVDNSEHSNKALELGLLLAKAFGAKVTGSHIYAAKMHDVRFKQMEFTLPAEYQEENELMRQRKIHDSLITMGLQLISDSYLDVMEKLCKERDIPFERKMMDGKNWECIVKDIESSDYDLVVIGALGTGAVKHSGLGSVCERVVRRVRKDVLVVKDTRPLAELAGPVVVGMDGSPQSFAGLIAAFSLSKVLGGSDPRVEAVAVYDPYLHYTVFNGIVNVLSEKASKIFRFKDQEQLHEDIIDTGLAKIYQSHLDIADHIAKERGEKLRVNLKDGKAFEKVYGFVEQTKPALLVTGRVGVHNGDLDIGSNAENLLRLVPCNMLLVSQKYVPPIDVKAEASMLWTEESSSRFERVPEQMRNIARTAVHRYAMERGHSIITTSIIDEVMAIFMPKTSQKMQALAIEVAKDELTKLSAADSADNYVCSICGKIVRGVKPVVCTVCKAPGELFGLIEKKTIESLAAAEGEVTEEETFDGIKVKWTLDARQRVSAIKDGYIRRRAKAQLEKTARTRKLTAIDTALFDEIMGRDVKDPTAALVTPHVGFTNELPSPLPMPQKWTKAAFSQRVEAGRSPTDFGSGISSPDGSVTLPRDIARSEEPGVSLPASAKAPFTWTDDAAARLNRVPAGFMRDNSKLKIEEYALEQGATTISLDIAEGGLARARELMAQMISSYTAGKMPSSGN